MNKKTPKKSLVAPLLLGASLLATSVHGGFVVRLFYDLSLDTSGARTRAQLMFTDVIRAKPRKALKKMGKTLLVILG